MRKKISKEDIERELNKFFEGKDEFPSIKHYEWEEDGKKYSSWKINTGSNILNCGDGGMKLFLEAFKKQGNE